MEPGVTRGRRHRRRPALTCFRRLDTINTPNQTTTQLVVTHLERRPKGRDPLAPINQELVREKAADIRHALACLRQYGHMEREAFLEEETTISAAKYQFVVAIEAAQTLCNHLAARIARQAPASYADCYTIIQRAGIIPVGAETGIHGQVPQPSGS